MSLPPDQPPPTKPKLTPEERRARYTDRRTTIRLRMLIFRELENRGITTPAAIGEALDMPPARRPSCCAAISGARAMSRGCRLRQLGWGCRCRAYDSRDRGAAAVLAQVDRMRWDA
jgi:hypothetical protein